MNSWKNHKAYIKQKARTIKKSLKSTGGGPPHPPLDPDSEKLLSTLDDDDVEIRTNFDSEARVPMDESQEVADEVEIENTIW